MSEQAATASERTWGCKIGGMVGNVPAALEEAEKRNRDVAQMILRNDRTEAVEWAKGLTLRTDLLVEVEAAPASQDQNGASDD